MIRIVHVLPTLATGGAEIMTERLIASLDRSRFENIVVSLSTAAGPVADRLKALGTPIFQCGVRQGIPNIRGSWRFAHLIRRLDPDLLQGWMYHGNLACEFASCFMRRNAPTVWSIHNMNENLDATKWSTKLTIRAGGKLAHRAAAVITPSELNTKLHVNRFGYRLAKWEVIPNGFDTDRFQPCADARFAVRREFGFSDDTLLVGTFARFAPVKDHANLLAAAARVHAARPNTRFLLAGRDVDERNEFLREQVDLHGLRNAVRLLGERQDLPRLMASLDLLAVPSYSECFPLVVGEAMSSGVPCVVTATGDCAFLIGDAGRVVPPRNSTALANAIIDVLSLPPNEMAALSRKGRERVIRHFSLPAVVRQYEALYQRLTDHLDVSGAERTCPA